MGAEHAQTPFWAARRRCPVEEGELRLLSAWELLETRRESGELVQEGLERALCSNACLIARALEREGRSVYPDGRAVLKALSVEDIARLSGQWGAFNREVNPSPLDREEETEARKNALEQAAYARLQWRVLRAFGALPTERRARDMTDRDYLWCALNLVLDREEELDRLCPRCREQAEADTCPVCGDSRESWGHNTGFDWARFEQLKGENAGD